MDDAEIPELSSPVDLFTLDWRVRWHYPRLPRWRFKAPQSASIRLIGTTQHQRQTGGAEAEPGLSPLEKFRLIKETDETCYWCGRSIGTKVTVRGRQVRLRLHWDHITPEHIGGASDATNMVPSCHLCNGWKAGKVFAAEASIRSFLEARWDQELAAPAAEKPSAPAHIAAAEYANTARTVARPPPGRPPTTPHTSQPTVPATRPGLPWNFRSLSNKPVRVVDGIMRGHMGVTAGESRERKGWVRVLVGASHVPWRFLPEQLALLEL